MPSGICNCDLAFANMFCWQEVYRSAWAEVRGFLVIRFRIDGGERIGYMQPVAFILVVASRHRVHTGEEP